MQLTRLSKNFWISEAPWGYSMQKHLTNDLTWPGGQAKRERWGLWEAELLEQRGWEWSTYAWHDVLKWSIILLGATSDTSSFILILKHIHTVLKKKSCCKRGSSKRISEPINLLNFLPNFTLELQARKIGVKFENIPWVETWFRSKRGIQAQIWKRLRRSFLDQ